MLEILHLMKHRHTSYVPVSMSDTNGTHMHGGHICTGDTTISLFFTKFFYGDMPGTREGHVGVMAWVHFIILKSYLRGHNVILENIGKVIKNE